MPEVGESSKVVLFTGGPVLDKQVLRFVSRIEQEPSIDLVAIISQSPIRGSRGIVVDLWRRRGLVALPLLLHNGIAALINVVFRPRDVLERHRLSNAVKDRIHFFGDIHGEVALDLVRDLEPALGLVYGGPILKPELFSIPRLGTLGIHHGKVPDYRGKKTTFWALYNGETEVGVIIQKISNNLDAGDIVRQSTVSVRNRPLPLVKKDLERIGIDMYLGAIKDIISGTARLVPQPSGSRHFYKDPTAIELLRFWGRYLVRVIRGRNAA